MYERAIRVVVTGAVLLAAVACALGPVEARAQVTYGLVAATGDAVPGGGTFGQVLAR